MKVLFESKDSAFKTKSAFRKKKEFAVNWKKVNSTRKCMEKKLKIAGQKKYFNNKFLIFFVYDVLLKTKEP